MVLSSVSSAGSRHTEYVVGGGSVDLIPGTERLRRIACSAAVREGDASWYPDLSIEMHHSVLASCCCFLSIGVHHSIVFLLLRKHQDAS